MTKSIFKNIVMMSSPLSPQNNVTNFFSNLGPSQSFLATPVV